MNVADATRTETRISYPRRPRPDRCRSLIRLRPDRQSPCLPGVPVYTTLLARARGGAPATGRAPAPAARARARRADQHLHALPRAAYIHGAWCQAAASRGARRARRTHSSSP